MYGYARKVLVVAVALSFSMLAPRSAVAAVVDVDDGVNLYFEEHGSGVPLVFVHGWTGSGAVWGAQVPYFSKEYRVITVDLRSHGNSGKLLVGNTIPQFARDLKILIDKLGLQNPVLVGHSMGVSVLLDYYKQFGASNVKALGLVDMTPCRLCAQAWNSQVLVTPSELADFDYAFQQDRHTWFSQFAKLLFKNVPSPDVVEALYRSTMRTPTVVALSLGYDLGYRNYTSLLPSITVPTCIFAARSGLFPNGIETGKYMHTAIPNSQLVVFENTGHMIQMEDPERFNKELESFLRSAP